MALHDLEFPTQFSEGWIVFHQGNDVRAAFTQNELAQMAAAAGLKGAEVTRRWPARMLLMYVPSREQTCSR